MKHPIIVRGSGGLYSLCVPVEGKEWYRVIYVHHSYREVEQRKQQMTVEIMDDPADATLPANG
jgi:hypothetical protein